MLIYFINFLRGRNSGIIDCFYLCKTYAKKIVSIYKNFYKNMARNNSPLRQNLCKIYANYFNIFFIGNKKCIASINKKLFLPTKTYAEHIQIILTF